MNREEILSTVQMKNETHLAPSLAKVTNSIIPEDARGVIANTNMNETRKEKNPIIEPQQNPNSNIQMITSLT